MASRYSCSRRSRILARLKEVSPSLARLDSQRKLANPWKHHIGILSKVRPTEQRIKHAAFVLNEMSSPVPRLDMELHRARVENRVRPLADGEQIDLARLAFDIDGLPSFDGPVPERYRA
jgi:hypothetical protein